MKFRFPRVSGDIPFVLGGKIWNKFCDFWESLDFTVSPPLQMVNGPTGRTITLRPEGKNYQYGIVICPPDGSPHLIGNVFYVKTAYPSNNDGDKTKPLKLTAYPTGHALAQTVIATNTHENQEDTHHVQAGAYVRLYSDYDWSTPPILRWSFDGADENYGGIDCGSSSSSSSSGSQTVCLDIYQCMYFCETTPGSGGCPCPTGPHVGPVTYIGSMCSDDNADPVDTWFLAETTSTGCVFIKKVTTQTPCDVSADPCPDQSTDTPAPPTAAETAACCGSGSGSGSGSGGSGLVCVWLWICKFNCTTKSWGRVLAQGVNCQTMPTTGTWLATSDPCKYNFYKSGANCPGAERVRDCGDAPSPPSAPDQSPDGSPGFMPPGCCDGPSIGSSGGACGGFASAYNFTMSGFTGGCTFWNLSGILMFTGTGTDGSGNETCGWGYDVVVDGANIHIGLLYNTVTTVLLIQGTWGMSGNADGIDLLGPVTSIPGTYALVTSGNSGSGCADGTAGSILIH